MSKRSNARRRKAEREQQKKKQQRFIISVTVAVIAMGAVFLGFWRIANPTEIAATERNLLDPIRGNPDAPVTITEWAAYGCEACQSWHEYGVVDTLLEEFPDRIKFVYRDMPIISPQYSQEAAEVAECALDQGNDLYWAMHDAIYERAIIGTTTQSQMVALGETLDGMDMATLTACVENNTHQQTVRFDLQRGTALSIRSTPTWFVNERRVFEANPDTLSRIIREELARLEG